MKTPSNVLKLAGYVAPNTTELSQLIDMNTGSQSDLKNAMMDLLETRVKNVISTLGAAEVAHITENGKRGSATSHNGEVVDIISAGNAFNAGLAFALVQHNDLHKAIPFANRVSALEVTGSRV